MKGCSKVKKELISELIYNKDIQGTMDYLMKCSDAEDLQLYAYNYNWSNGFEIPNIIINNSNCSMSTALYIFYAADGFKYLMEKTVDTNMEEWKIFIENLHSKIIMKSFVNKDIAFQVPLTKIQVFKLKKVIDDKETIFLENHSGIYCNIDL